ncbi:hypothetical protein L208DRAFT_1514239 [Tricholoma matsutake]|nr:hypothetical protein L208DRAFT_1514239 [Tricholoma matsutake 945]
MAEVLNSKVSNRRRCKILYLVQWEGYQGTDEETSWLPVMELDHTQELLADFHTRYPQKPGPSPA